MREFESDNALLEHCKMSIEEEFAKFDRNFEEMTNGPGLESLLSTRTQDNEISKVFSNLLEIDIGGEK